MINVNTLFEAVCRIINKQAYTAYADFNRFLPMAELQLFKERLGLPEEYQPGRPVPRVAAAVTQKVSDDLRPFIRESPVTITATGSAPFPAGYARHIATRAGGRKVEIVEQALLSEKLESLICPPTAKHPVCALYPDRLQFYPASLASADTEYYRFPRASRWGFVLNGNGRPAYDAAGSVDSEFPMDCLNDLAVRVCSLFGMSIKAADVAQYTEAKKQQGI